jgi:hypothetical protein
LSPTCNVTAGGGTGVDEPRSGTFEAARWERRNQEVPGMDMQSRNRDMARAYQSRSDELERQRMAARQDEPTTEGDPDMSGVPVEPAEPRMAALQDEPTTEGDPDMSGVPVEPAEPGGDSRLGGAVVGGALGAVAGAIVAGPAGAIVGGAVGAAGGAVVASNNSSDDMVVDIDRRDVTGDIRRPRDDDLESGL